MAKSYFLFVLLLLSLVSCQEKLKLIEVRNDDGQVVKSFQVDQDSVKQDWEYSFDLEGNKVDQSYYVDGTLDSVRIIFYPEGSVEIKEPYKAGKLHGSYQSFHENGQLKFEAQYDQDVLGGIAKSYFPSGAIKEEVAFANNEENGPFKEYYKNGNLKTEGSYVNGDNEDGLLKIYDKEGTLIKKMECEMGKCKTIWKLDGEVNGAKKI